MRTISVRSAQWSPLCIDLPGPIAKGVPSARLGRYDFHHCDELVDWALEEGIAHVKGHVLLWHVTSPTDILGRMNDDDLKEAMRR